MDILITEKAKQHLRKNGIHVLTVLFVGCGKCNSPSRRASVGTTTPAGLSRYISYEVDDIMVHVRDDVRKHKESLTVSMSKFLWNTELFAD